MPAAPISVQLSKFEHIEILRSEIEAREEELKQTERQIREILWELERQQYLQSLHPLFQKLEAPKDAANLQQLNGMRDALTDAIQIMKHSLAALEAETAGQSAPPSRGLSRAAAAPGPAAPAPPGPRRKFDF
ncbi:MAG TPA: hypothetical protein VEK08_05040 [Planctomycetota bacterium]|nr:hypothetical protein [Planctomycetota bacterium]